MALNIGQGTHGIHTRPFLLIHGEVVTALLIILSKDLQQRSVWGARDPVLQKINREAGVEDSDTLGFPYSMSCQIVVVKRQNTGNLETRPLHMYKTYFVRPHV